ncbi:phosphotransferase system enzyme I (PtsI) [Mycoplasmoides fastidiosum]|uniref:Phosphoenolpyruvate-protein phosphotransferase n=1 Tax=Mycoplasmoides fastidiosum TaxID=92758 RepID=A0ABU0LYL2_9BACT|nr:phosphoenolpyruvate--protein phosphotransferase [Mycoplasmoides fastidiosum]MDQ0513703.1 phosphotransferase system enzyme I (PtsI) [Mycoplasmoides fastidiosum]UUD37874.1 phosphoenolpyruvate--protein phosphotransferase [Mycoplasmoides fastidiosum]
MVKKFQGIGASNGIAIAPAFVLKELVFNLEHEVFSDVTTELDKYQKLRTRAKQAIDQIIEIASAKLSQEKVDIFEAHKQLIDDEEIRQEIITLIKEEQKPVAVAIDSVYNKYFEIFSAMEDEYFKERSSDIYDVKKRLLAFALNLALPDLLSINSECIILAHDLTPSETAQLDPQFVKGFLTNIGGRTSHAAIMARTLEIPAVVSLKNITDVVTNNVLLGMNGSNGVVEVINDDATKDAWLKQQKNFGEYLSSLEKYKTQEVTTTDGVKVLIEGNIGHPHDVEKVLSNGGQGIGLFRSEFLYMEANNWPTEDEQYQSYKQALEKMGDKVVIIRTLDIGGDKHLNYFDFPQEMNPFLGYRALRLSLDKRDVFETQLRALLRASVYGKLGIMFPMVATVEEFLTAKNLTLKLANDLRQEGFQVADNFEIGMMIEIPTAAVLAETFAKHADFFSIGSNDLIQYSLAVDRMSEDVNYLYQPNFPGLLSMIKIAIDGCHRGKKIIGMCGEMAGEILSVPLLMGMGLDAFSMSASSIPQIKYLVSKISMKDCQELAAKALTLESEVEVNQLVKKFLNENNVVWY